MIFFNPGVIIDLVLDIRFMKIIGIIPARGSSTRTPNKNTRIFQGKPLIAWAILSARKSKLLDRVIVSTDSHEIAKIAKKYGAEVPFLRPAEFSTSTIGIEPTLKHAYQWLLENENYKADGIALLMATNPLRQMFHIDESVKLFVKNKVDSVVSVNETPSNHTPYWTLVRSERGKISLFGGVSLANIITRGQDFPQKCYARNDLVYVLKPKNLFEKPSGLYGKKVELYETDPLFETDINTPEEWLSAEMKFRRLNNKKTRE